jgi:hypothetical protein
VNQRLALPAAAIGAIFIIAIVIGFACFASSGDDDNTVSANPTATPSPQFSGPAEEALGRYVESTLGTPYLEDCSRADASQDTGKTCSTFRGEREGQRAYVLGRTFSEGTQWAFLGQTSGGQWAVVNTTPITRDNAAVPGIPWPLRTGVDVVVTGAGSCGTVGDGLNVREGPALNQRAVDCISDGTVVQLSSGPAPGDNFQWFQLAGRTGWVVSDYLRYPDAAR